jgi:hypothetical protein
MKRRRPAPRPPARRRAGDDTTGSVAEVVEEIEARHETGPRLTGGDLDADWKGAWAVGDEAVGGSTAMPDQDVVDELGEALGVAQEPDAEVLTSAEILAERDRHRWTLEREIALDEEDRGEAAP